MQRKTTRRRLTRIGFATLNVAILAIVVYFVMGARSSSDTRPLATQVASATAAGGAGQTIVNPLDQVSAVDIASTAANMAGMQEASLINGQVVAEAVQAQTVSLSLPNIISKPEVVQSKFASNKDIKTYVVQAGDTVNSIAAKFGITADSVEWSNGLVGNVVAAGTTLHIPPINGIVYTVKAGDTPQSLAQTYKVGQDSIISYNDAELGGIHAGELILIPGGQKPAPSSYYGFGGYSSWFGNVSGNYNLYDRNNCTWWVALRWAQVGHPVMPLLGNASQWYENAQRDGLAVGRTPRKYAAASTGGIYGVSTWGWGHVAFVEGVNADGSVNISEMNVNGWASSQVWHSTVPASVAATWYYIYP